MRLLAVLALLLAVDQALAQAAADYTFEAQAAVAYHRVLQRLSNAHRLDDDDALLSRVRADASRLIVAARAGHGRADGWSWEVHVTSDPTISAFCMAGGKILVGAAFVGGLRLDDDELAMLLAHEMAHALANHRRERAPVGGMEEGVAWDNRQAAAAFAQESEADRIGLSLAHDAGFSFPGLLGFFDKLAAAEPAGTFNSTHPSAAKRAEQARAWVAEAAAAPR